MSDRVVLLTIPGLAASDVPHMPNLSRGLAGGDRAVLAPSCPCTAGPMRANLATGVTCGQHGIVADHLYIREHRRLESDPAWNDWLEAPTIWQLLSEHQPEARSAICFVPGSHAHGGALTCNLRGIPQALRTHPASLANELPCPPSPWQASDPLWAAEVASRFVEMSGPDFLWCEFSQIAAAAEVNGPDSPQVREAHRAVDAALGLLFSDVENHYGSPLLWLVVSPYTISPTRHVLYPNRLLLEAGLLLNAGSEADGSQDPRHIGAFALTDRQISHIYVRDQEPTIVSDVVQLFTGRPGVAEVLSGEERSKYDLVHKRAGDVIVISARDSWQDAASLPSDKSALVVRGSHGAPATDEEQRGTIFASERGVLAGRLLLDTDVCDLVLRQFGI